LSTGTEKQNSTVIEAGRSIRHYWKDIWRYRELFYVLSWRDIAVRYKQTAIGVAWAVIRPLVTMVVLTVIFGHFAKLPSEGDAPYAIMVYAAMLPWHFFANSLSQSSFSLVNNPNLITKVYFPRMIIPASTVFTNLVDFLISFAVLLLLMAYYRYVPSLRFLLLPAFLFFALLSSFGVGLFFTALNVKYRDLRFVVPFVVQLGLYASPVAYSSTIIPEHYRFVYSLNPMVGVIDGFRWAILGGESEIYWPGFLTSAAVTLLFLLLGVHFFRKVERTFADVI